MLNLSFNQLYYFIQIVQSDFNLSQASKQNHISQSALSQFVKNLEVIEEVKLFEREGSRLIALTPAGEAMYKYAVEILEKADELTQVIGRESNYQKGTITIGVPTNFLRTYFTRFFPEMFFDNPDLNLQIIESGDLVVKQQLIDRKLQIAIIGHPTQLNTDDFFEHDIIETKIIALMSPKHPLSKVSRLTWSDLKNYRLVAQSANYSTYNSLINKLKEVGVTQQQLMTADSWDFLAEIAQRNQVVALLPTSPFERYYKYLENLGLVEVLIDDPVKLKWILAYPKKDKYTGAEKFVIQGLFDMLRIKDDLPI